ncbi:MAG TPA: UBP-type zinc finger domain-containing protein [Bryocella sp.]|nr:UBP-type zinc finger domain-containing protein [Bryocella sp.]
MASCEHVKHADPKVTPSGDGCAECLQTGQRWVQLRMCMVCGHVGCCDSSPGRHARNHFHDTGHPVMQPHQSGDWKWCYVHDAYV